MKNRKTLRLTFKVVDGKMQLVSKESLDMICPPSVGERPEKGKHSGFWAELQDEKGTPLFHRIINSPLGDSVEVHSPDRKIERVFGEVKENMFEVLLPDDSAAKSIVFMGESLEPVKAQKMSTEFSRELVRFDLATEGKGGK